MSSPLQPSPLSQFNDEGRQRSPSDPRRERTLSQTRPRAYSNVSRTVLLAVDTSENSRRAFEWYLENVHKNDDLLIVTHIPEVPKLPSFSWKSGISPPVDDWKKILDENNARARRLEEDYEGTCVQKKLKYKVRGETSKNTGEGILKIADEELADVIVVGARGGSGASRTLLGSVSEYITRNATVPVMIVPIRPITARRRNSMVAHGLDPQ